MADLKSIREGSRSDEPRKRPLAKVSGRVSISRTLARPPLGETWPCLWAISSDHSPRSNPSSKVLLLKGTATDCTARRFLFFRTLIHSLPLFHLTVFFLQNSGPTRVGYARKLEKKKFAPSSWTRVVRAREHVSCNSIQRVDTSFPFASIITIDEYSSAVLIFYVLLQLRTNAVEVNEEFRIRF